MLVIGLLAYCTRIIELWVSCQNSLWSGQVWQIISLPIFIKRSINTQKIDKLSLPNISIFLLKKQKNLSVLWQDKYGVKKSSLKMRNNMRTTFSECTGRELSQRPILEKKICLAKMPRRKGFFLSKNPIFAHFLRVPRKSFQLIANRTILILEGDSMPHLKPKFSVTHVKKVLI